MSKNDALCATDKKRYYRTDTHGIEDNMSDGWDVVFEKDQKINRTISDLTDDTGLLKTGIRVVKSERFQRFCLKCGKILPTKIKQNFTHNCEKPDFLL